MLIFDFGKTLGIARISSKNQLEINPDIVNYTADIFEAPERLEALIDYLYPDKEELQHEAVYISLSAGCGLQYKTFGVAQDAFMVNGSRTTKAEQNVAILEVCRNHLTVDYTPSVMNVYATDTDYILSVAYVPNVYLDNLKAAFSKAGISVFDIKPFGSLLYQALNKEELKQVIFDIDNELILVNSLGLIGWCKPDDFANADLEIANNYLVTTSEDMYSITNDMRDTPLVDLKNIKQYLKADYNGEINTCVIAALALLKRQKTEFKGGLGDVANKFRLIFDKRRNKEN